MLGNVAQIHLTINKSCALLIIIIKQFNATGINYLICLEVRPFESALMKGNKPEPNLSVDEIYSFSSYAYMQILEQLIHGRPCVDLLITAVTRR